MWCATFIADIAVAATIVFELLFFLLLSLSLHSLRFGCRFLFTLLVAGCTLHFNWRTFSLDRSNEQRKWIRIKKNCLIFVRFRLRSQSRTIRYLLAHTNIMTTHVTVSFAPWNALQYGECAAALEFISILCIQNWFVTLILTFCASPSTNGAENRNNRKSINPLGSREIGADILLIGFRMQDTVRDLLSKTDLLKSIEECAKNTLRN